MPHHTPLIATIVGGIVLAFILGALARRVRVSPLVGYLLANVLVGPSTLGFVADPALAGDLAEIGVILLMFGVGLHFSLEDLLSARGIALPGALAQIVFATGFGMALTWSLDWKPGAGLVFGSRCRSPARWFCCAPCRSGVPWKPNRGASRSAG